MKHAVRTEKVWRGSLLRRGTPCLPSVESNGCDLGFEAEPSKTADKLRGDTEPLDYQRVASGLIVLKQKAKPAERFATESPDEPPADHVFRVPKKVHWLPCSTS